MARVYPFRAWRYNPSAVRLDDVVTQPWDKITPAMQQAYYQRSPFNIVRILLGLPELFDAERGESVYTRASRDFEAWRSQGVLTREKEPCVFAYAQRFSLPGTETMPAAEIERRGFIALGRLCEYAEQVVFPLEPTAAAAKPAVPVTDRLNLLRATRAQFGQIMMLYSDPAGSVEKLLYDGSGPADMEVTDEYGVLHRLWRVSDAPTIRLLTTAMADKKLILADGQSRYETALAYAREHGAAAAAPAEHSATQLPQPPYPEAAAMMTFIHMDPDGPAILPVHRVVHGLVGFDPGAFALAAERFFDVERLPAVDSEIYSEKLHRQQGTAFIAVMRDGAFLLKPKPEAVGAALAHLPERQRQVGVAQLHALVIHRLLGLDPAGEETHLRALRDAGEAVDQVRRGEAEIAFLVNPVTMEQLREVAFAGERLPPKSTDFFPKLLSGLAIYALD